MKPAMSARVTCPVGQNRNAAGSHPGITPALAAP
jgi:hypothetical protein